MTQSLETKTQGRLLAIGDIHGCLEQLSALMIQVAPALADQVVFLGDYVDRGPDSAGVIDYLIKFGETFPATVFLRGNHEQMFCDYLDGQDPSAFLINGGRMTLNSYKNNGQWPIPPSHWIFLKTLLDYYETQDCIFVHAGLRPGVPLAAQDSSDLLWIRRDFISSDYDWGKIVVYGHTPHEKPFLTETRLGLDTGCVYGRRLTCCDVRSKQVWQT
ncbi:MAG: metallophosphoesterase family protein [Desulfuromonadales bacterium]|nr:metallophosphoesterase family protein [Desulfuromonadales bacterium]